MYGTCINIQLLHPISSWEEDERSLTTQMNVRSFTGFCLISLVAMEATCATLVAAFRLDDNKSLTIISVGSSAQIT